MLFFLVFFSRKRFACGRASSPEGGWDIVVAGGDQDSFQATASSDIYNTRTGFWRPGRKGGFYYIRRESWMLQQQIYTIHVYIQR